MVDKVLRYVEGLNKVKEKCVSRVVERMAAGEASVSLAAFVEGMASYMHGALLSSVGWRHYLSEVFNLQPPDDFTASR